MVVLPQEVMQVAPTKATKEPESRYKVTKHQIWDEPSLDEIPVIDTIEIVTQPAIQQQQTSDMEILIPKKPPVKDYWGGFGNDFDDITDAVLSEADQVSMI